MKSAILRAKAPSAPERLTAEIVAFVQTIRATRICSNRPASPRRWTGRARSTELDAVALDPAQVSDTLGVLLKYQDDIGKIQGAKASELIQQARAELRQAQLA